MNQQYLQSREDALPEWIRARLLSFHEQGGEEFTDTRWRYELIIAELAVLYRDSNGVDSPSVLEYAALHVTSRYQHDFAKVLASAPPEASTAGTIAAYSDDPLYRGTEDTDG